MHEPREIKRWPVRQSDAQGGRLAHPPSPDCARIFFETIFKSIVESSNRVEACSKSDIRDRHRSLCKELSRKPQPILKRELFWGFSDFFDKHSAQVPSTHSKALSESLFVKLDGLL